MFKSFRFITAVLALILTAGILSACSQTRDTHGNLLTQERIELISVGQSSKADVIRAIGTPTTKAAFNDDIWYYIGLETVRQGFLDPKVENRQIYMAQFNENGRLATFAPVEREALDIPIVSRETPTHGTELTVLEQFVGNLGRFNSDMNEDRQAR